MELKHCFSAVDDMVRKEGSYWIKRQQKLYYAIKNKQGRFAEMSDDKRLKMMTNIEIDVFGVSRIEETQTQHFLKWFREVFGHKYSEV